MVVYWREREREREREDILCMCTSLSVKAIPKSTPSETLPLAIAKSTAPRPLSQAYIMWETDHTSKKWDTAAMYWYERL